MKHSSSDFCFQPLKSAKTIVSSRVIQNQATGQAWLTGHGLLTPNLEHYILSQPLEVRS